MNGKILTSKETHKMLLKQHEKSEDAQKLYRWRDAIYEGSWCPHDCDKCESIEEKDKADFHKAEQAFEKKWGVHWFTGKPTS